MCHFAVCAGFFKTIPFAKEVDHRLQLDPRLIQERRVLREANVLRSNRGIADLCRDECAPVGVSAPLPKVKGFGGGITQNVVCADDKLQVHTLTPFDK